MSDISILTAWHKSQLGTKETPVNNVIYNTHFYGGEVNGDSFPWCCTYIWDSFVQNGLAALFCGGQKTAYCPFVVDYAQKTGRWFEGDYREGDLLLFDWDGDGAADHIGYCLSWDGYTARTIEGNAGDAVSQQYRSVNDIMGAYRPEYREDETPETPDSKDIYTVRKGDTLWGIAEKFLGSGLRFREIMERNGLASDAIYPGMVLKLEADEDATTVIVATVRKSTEDKLYELAKAEEKTIGAVIDSVFGGIGA